MAKDEMPEYGDYTLDVPGTIAMDRIIHPKVDDRPLRYKCPDFPYCKVCGPIGICLSVPKDMEHFLRYHG